MANLNMHQMIDVQNAISDAHNHVFNQFIGENQKELVIFLAQLANNTSYYHVFTNEGLLEMTNRIFMSYPVREYVLRITSAFLARFGDSHLQYQALLDTLTWSYAIYDNSPSANTDFQTIPSEIANRLPSMSRIRGLLEANKWLVTLTILSLYLKLDLQRSNKNERIQPSRDRDTI